MRVQVLLLVFCAVAHGAPRMRRSLLGGYGGGAPPAPPSPSYGAPSSGSPPPPSLPTQSYLPPDQSSPPAPSPLYSAPTPEVIPEQPQFVPSQPAQDYSAPAPVEPAQDYAAPAPVEPAQDYAAPAPVQPAQDYAAPAPVQPAQDYAAPAPVEPAQDYAAPAPAPAPAPTYGTPSAVPPPVVDQSYLPPDKTVEVSSGSSEEAVESIEESAESSEEIAGDIVNLSSAQTIDGKTLSDSKIQSILSQEANAAPVETGSNQGYSYNAPAQSCKAGETLNSNGVCETVKSFTNYYLFDVPKAPEQPLPPTQTPEKRLHYNVLLVRVPTENQQIQNINLSRDEQKTLVYVVRDPPKGAKTFPAPVTEAYKPEAPAVFYVTPAAKASSEEEEGPVGYGNAVGPPSPPTKGYSYNPPSYA